MLKSNETREYNRTCFLHTARGISGIYFLNMLKYMLSFLVVFFGVYFYYDSSSVVHQMERLIPVMKDLFHTSHKAPPVSSSKSNSKVKTKLFTADELRKYIKKEVGLYLAILGEVYDVTKGERYYGPGGSYHFFTGRDCSRAFVTGDFTESGLTDDILDLDPSDIKSLYQWKSVYVKDYKYKGKLIGRFYDPEGKATQYKQQVDAIMKFADSAERKKSEGNLQFPPCNVEWSAELGSRVWCTKLSGGIQRNWEGVPRMLYLPGSDSHRCACVNLENHSALQKGNLKEYPDCHPKSTSCYVHNT